MKGKMGTNMFSLFTTISQKKYNNLMRVFFFFSLTESASSFLDILVDMWPAECQAVLRRKNSVELRKICLCFYSLPFETYIFFCWIGSWNEIHFNWVLLISRMWMDINVSRKHQGFFENWFTNIQKWLVYSNGMINVCYYYYATIKHLLQV